MTLTPLSYEPSMRYLQAAGYVLLSNGLWQSKPDVTHVTQMTSLEYQHLKFLFTHWNFGGLYFEPPPIDSDKPWLQRRKDLGLRDD